MQIAFELRSDFQGTVTLPDETEVPKFSGGVLAIGPSSIDVAELLQAGGGTIVVETAQQPLVALLEAYPPLKQCPVPDGVAAVQLYELWSRAALNEEAHRRGLQGYTRLSSDELARVLQEQDRVLTSERAGADGAQPAALRPGADAGDVLAATQPAPASDPEPDTSGGSTRRRASATTTTTATADDTPKED